MLDIAEIIDATGNLYIPRPGNPMATLFPGKVIDLAAYQFISDETGKENKQTSHSQPDYIQDVLPYRLLAETTGADIYECRKFLIIMGNEVASHNSITNASFFIREDAALITKEKQASASLPIRSTQPINISRQRYEITDLAKSLRQLSGLDIESLARIFKVSRVTYHRWLRGLPLSKRHRDYILEILPLLEEAAQRLGSPEAVSTWLLTPISSGGKKPVDYLAEKHYDLFRGFLLRQRTGKELFHPLQPSNRAFRPRKREEIEDVRDQLRPHTWYNEDNDPNNTIH